MHRLILAAAIAAAPCLAQAAAAQHRGVQLFEAHDRAGARAEFTAELQRNDRDARAHLYLGRLALVENDADAAVGHLARAAELEPSVSAHHQWLGAALMAQTVRAAPLRRPGLARRFRSAFERAVALDATNLEARDRLVMFYAMAPGVMGGSVEKAREQAQAIARLDAMRGHVAAARIAMTRKDSAGAVRALEAAIATQPDSLRAYAMLATWYADAGMHAQAFAAIDRYAARRPGDPYAGYHVGRIAAATGQQLARGEQALRAFIAAPPRDAAPPVVSVAWQRLGKVLERQGQVPAARSALEQAVRIDPHNSEARAALEALARAARAP